MSHSKTLFSILFVTAAMILSAAPERIVSLSPALTELVCFLGKESALIARSEACDYPEKIRHLPTVGKFAAPVTETVLALKPDLILANSIINPGAVRTFRQAGIRVELLPCATLKEYRCCVQRLGVILDAGQAAQREMERIDAFLNRPFPSSGKKVLWVVWDSPLMIAGAGSLPDEVMTLAGGINCAGGVKTPYFKASFEWIIRNQPDVIVWTASPNGWKTGKFRQYVRAAQQGAVIDERCLDLNMLQRPGPRLPDGIRALHEKLK